MSTLLTPPYGVNNAKLGWYNELSGASSTVADALVCLIPNTNERYSADTATVVFETPSNFTGDYVAIGAHTLGSTGKTVTIGVSSATSGAFTTVHTSSPSNDNAIMATFTSQSIRRVQIAITTSGDDFYIGVVYAGAFLQMQRPLYGDHSPINLSQQVEYQNNESDTGNFLSRSIIRRGLVGSFSWRHLQAEWIRTYFKPFQKHAAANPFFILWRPTTYPLECAFCWTVDDISPRNMGIQDFMELTLNVRGYGGVE